jgi:hypothetical protein
MKINILFVFLTLPFLGCSKHSDEGKSGAKGPAAPALPFEITIVKTPEAKEIEGVIDQAKALLAAKYFDQLDALAAKMRESKQQYASGNWMLHWFYDEALDLNGDNSNEEFTERRKVLQDWINAKPDSITPRVALANLLTSYAWKARGTDTADKVATEGWRLFAARLNDANLVLKRARTLKQQCPVLWSVVLTCDLGLQVSRQQYESDFKAAIQAWPDFQEYYFLRAGYLLPRWYGKPGEWEKDLGQSADRIGGEAGDKLYAQVVWYMRDYISDEPNPFKASRLSWQRVDRGFEGIIKQFPDALAPKNVRVQVAWMAGDLNATRKYFADTKGKCDLGMWGSEEKLQSFVDWYRTHQ